MNYDTKYISIIGQKIIPYSNFYSQYQDYLYKYNAKFEILYKDSISNIVNNSNLTYEDRAYLFLLLLGYYASKNKKAIAYKYLNSIYTTVVNELNIYKTKNETENNAGIFTTILEKVEYSEYANKYENLIIKEDIYEIQYNIAENIGDYGIYVGKLAKFKYNNTDTFYIFIETNNEFVEKWCNLTQFIFSENILKFEGFFYGFKENTSINQTNINTNYIIISATKNQDLYIQSQNTLDFNRFLIQLGNDQKYYLFDLDSTNSVYTYSTTENIYVDIQDSTTIYSYWVSENFSTNSSDIIFTLRVDKNAILPIEFENTSLDSTNLLLINILNYNGDKTDILSIWSHIYNTQNIYQINNNRPFYIKSDGFFTYVYFTKHSFDIVLNVISGKTEYKNLIKAEDVSLYYSQYKKFDAYVNSYLPETLYINNDFNIHVRGIDRKYNYYYNLSYYSEIDKIVAISKTLKNEVAFQVDNILEQYTEETNTIQSCNYTPLTTTSNINNETYDATNILVADIYDATIITFTNNYDYYIFEIDKDFIKNKNIPVIVNAAINLSKLLNTTFNIDGKLNNNALQLYFSSDLYLIYSRPDNLYILLTPFGQTAVNIKIFPITLKNSVVINDFVKNIYLINGYSNYINEIENILNTKFKKYSINNPSNNNLIDLNNKYIFPML